MGNGYRVSAVGTIVPQPGFHIYDESKIETLCGEPNPEDELGHGIVFSNSRDLMVYSSRHTEASKADFIGTGYFVYGQRGVIFRLCKECYAIHTLIAA